MPCLTLTLITGKLEAETGCATACHLVGHASLVTEGYEAPTTMYPRANGPIRASGWEEAASRTAAEGLGEAAWVM